MNKVIIIGRLTKDPELRFTPNGVANCSFTLAVDRKYKSEGGEKQTDFIQCQAWRKTGELIAEYMKKGSKIAVDGSWQTRNYEGADGKRIYVNECIVNEMDFLDSKSNDGNTGNNSSYSNNNSGNTNNKGNTSSYNSNGNSNRSNSYEDPFSNNGGHLDISDSDLPF